MSMLMTHDLSRAWRDYLATGNTSSQFEAKSDDDAGNWEKGDVIRVGVRLHKRGEPEYFAENLTRDATITCEVLREKVGRGFKKQFNPYRLLRPTPLQQKQQGPLPTPSDKIDECGYRCMDPNHPWSLLARDPFSVLLLPNGYWACYYNFSPFEENGHFLWLPVRVRGNVMVLPHLPQEMTEEFLADGLTLFRNSQGLLLFFNSIHAGASQNHFHFQAVFTGDAKFAVETASVVQLGRYSYLDEYPINGIVFPITSDPSDVFRCIRRIDQAEKPYNLILLGESIYLIPRDPNHEIVAEFPYGVFGAMEMAGQLIIANRSNFDETNYDRVTSALKKIGLEREEIAQIVGEDLDKSDG